MHQAQIYAESVLFVCPALSFMKSLHRFLSYRPPGRSFLYIWLQIPPRPEFVGNSRERARRSPARGFQRLQAPLGAARKPTTAKRESRQCRSDFSTAKRQSRPPCPDFFTAKRESRPRRPEFATAKRESRRAARTSSRRSGKTTAPPGLLHVEAGKPTTAVAFARAGLFRPRGRPERRASL